MADGRRPVRNQIDKWATQNSLSQSSWMLEKERKRRFFLQFQHGISIADLALNDE